MKILGLNLGYMATASSLVDGEIVACVSQERFSRKKNDESYPKDAIEFVLAKAGVRYGAEVDGVAIGSVMHDIWHRLAHYYSGFSIADRLKEQHDYWRPVLYDNKQIAWHELYRDRMDFDQYPGNWRKLIGELSDSYYLNEADQRKVNEHIVGTISDHTGIPSDRFRFIDHHTSHAAYAYYASPFREGKTLVLTIDAFGDGHSASISVGEDGRLTRSHAISHQAFQVARIYRYVTLLMGMKPDEHEYKVMGLAPYAKPQTMRKAYEVFRNTLYVDGLDFKFREKPKDMYFYFRDKLEGCRFDGIAGGLQKFVEELLTEWVSNVVREFGVRRIVFAGGVAMNIKAIQKIAELDCVDELFIPPSPGDESLGMGAAYQLNLEMSGPKAKPLRSSYLGTEISPEETAALAARIRRESKPYELTENAAPAKVAGQLALGRVIGRCGGRMEFGARALGNRSIIADARSAKMIRVINEKIKNRDFWMPFAPAMLIEKADRYIKNPKGLKAPYMTIAFDTQELAQDHIAAGIHPADFTARPQMVDRETNPDFYALIAEFEKLTGVSGVLNTSFNLHGEPIVRSAEDAYRVFELTDIDDLWVGNLLVSKKR